MSNKQTNVPHLTRQTPFGQLVKRLAQNRVAVFGLCVFVLIIIIAFLAPWIAPYKYSEMNIANAFCKPCREHIFGTDDLGRDIFSRLLYGARYSLGIGLTAQIIAFTGGIFFGSIAGYFGGRAEELIMRGCDVLQSIPSLLMSIVISTALGTGFFNTAIALCLSGIASNCRATRVQFLRLRENEFVEAAQALNCSRFRIILKHILPNALSPMLIALTMGIGTSMINAASLSYLGLGIQPPTPEWGAMLSGARGYIRAYPYMILFPGLCIAIVVLSLNMFGDGLRDAMDPRLKK